MTKKQVKNYKISFDFTKALDDFQKIMEENFLRFYKKYTEELKEN